jgi:enterochelin esterase-like enzyme
MRILYSLLLLAAAAQLLTCTISSPTISLSGTTETRSITSTAFAGSKTGESTTQNILVYLPPSYNGSTSRYPVVYYLHGFDGDYTQISSNLPVFDSLMAAGTVSEFIIIGVNGNNTLGGSFYVNSLATGNWEDYLVNEVVSFIDTNYRTKTAAASRGIAGYSMGGFGSINLALKHPDVFGVVYALAPGLFDDTKNGVWTAFHLWSPRILNAYGAAFSPIATAPYYQIPDFSGIPPDPQIVQNWKNGFGEIPAKIAAYLAKPQRLTGIRINYNTGDINTWIPDGCLYFSAQLTASGITHDIQSYPGGHGENRDTIYHDSMAPFFSSKLVF